MIGSVKEKSTLEDHDMIYVGYVRQQIKWFLDKYEFLTNKPIPDVIIDGLDTAFEEIGLHERK